MIRMLDARNDIAVACKFQDHRSIVLVESERTVAEYDQRHLFRNAFRVEDVDGNLSVRTVVLERL